MNGFIEACYFQSICYVHSKPKARTYLFAIRLQFNGTYFYPGRYFHLTFVLLIRNQSFSFLINGIKLVSLLDKSSIEFYLPIDLLLYFCSHVILLVLSEPHT